MRKIFVTGLFLSCCFIALKSQMNQIEFLEYDLENGLHVILHQDNSTPIVAVNVLYHVGSKNEKPGRSGFAHFFEHLMFEGSENIERGEFSKYVESSGGVLNAYTTPDKTNYFELLPSNQLELGLWLESERMLHANVDQTGIETQREVVKEERRMRYENQPYMTWQLEILERSFKEHPYKTPPIGSMEDLNAAQEADYKQFYEDFYVPNNAVLSIAGDFDIEQTKMLIDKYFSAIPKSKKPIFRPNIIEPPLGGQVVDTVYDNIQLPAVFMSFRIPAQGTPDHYALSMLSTLLSGGQSSRLYKSLVDEKQLALQVANFPIPTEDPGIFVTLGLCNMGVDIKDLEKGMDEVIMDVKSNMITEAEFQKLRNQTESDFVNQFSSIRGIADNLANYYTYFSDTNLINTELDRFLAVNRGDIQRVANKYLKKDNRVVLYYLPKQTTP